MPSFVMKPGEHGGSEGVGGGVEVLWGSEEDEEDEEEPAGDGTRSPMDEPMISAAFCNPLEGGFLEIEGSREVMRDGCQACVRI